MYQVIIVFHVLFGLSVIGLVLMQQGKGADAGAAFGSGTSGSVFGAQGAASFLSRATALLATLFFASSLGLAVLNSNKGAVNDLMSTSAPEKETVAIPESIELKEKANATVPATAPVIPAPSIESEKKEVVQVPPQNTTTEIKETVVPEAEKIKAVTEKSVVEEIKKSDKVK